jgi:elongation factor G
MIDRLGAHPVPIQLPIGAEGDFLGLVDLINMKAIVYKDELGKDVLIEDIPEHMAEEAAQARETLLDEISHYDDELLEMILEEQEIPKDRLVAAIRKATLSSQMTPVLCGSSFKNKGVQPLLDAVIDFLPSPLDVPPVSGFEPVKGDDEDRPAVRNASDDEPFAALAVQDHGRPVRRQAHLLPRLLGQARGRLADLNINTGSTERVGRILMMHANDREDVHEVYAGDIAGGGRHQEGRHGRHAGAPDKPISSRR